MRFWILSFLMLFVTGTAGAGAVDDCINSLANGKSCAVKAAFSEQVSCIKSGCSGQNEVCLAGACIDRTLLVNRLAPGSTVFVSGGDEGFKVMTLLPVNLGDQTLKRIECPIKGEISLCHEVEEAI